MAKANVQPAYARSFGVASVHLSRRSECEGGTVEVRKIIESTPARDGTICRFFVVAPLRILRVSSCHDTTPHRIHWIQKCERV